MLSPEEIAKDVELTIRHYTYEQSRDCIAAAIREAVAEEREACALISRSNNAYETESDILNVGKSAYDTRCSEKAVPE